MYLGFLSVFGRLELLFLGAIRWDMSISSSMYAKYYFALRSLTEKEDFRRRYNRVLQVRPRAFPTSAPRGCLYFLLRSVC